MRRPKQWARTPSLLKFHRSRVLTADDPAAVRRHLAEAFAAFEAVHASEKKAA